MIDQVYTRAKTWETGKGRGGWGDDRRLSVRCRGHDYGGHVGGGHSPSSGEICVIGEGWTWHRCASAPGEWRVCHDAPAPAEVCVEYYVKAWRVERNSQPD